MQVLHVPTVNEDERSYENLFHLWRQFLHFNSDIIFDFSRCSFLRQNGVAFLGGLIRLITSKGYKVELKLDTLKNSVRTNLEQNGFMYQFDLVEQPPWRGNSVPYREDRSESEQSYLRYLNDEWLGRGWINISPALRNLIVGNVWEIYINSFDHGHSPVGLITCGQNYPSFLELKLTLVDFGEGIPNSVRNFMNNQDIDASDAMEWAFKRGNTTKIGEGLAPRGLGLDLLKSFVKMNKGELEIFSHEGYTYISEDKEIHEKVNSFYGGTLVNITLKTDEKYYCLASEVEDDSLFF
ncbi:ATPase, histidine kinase-, DNA gyrase B-, and HSP90-like domain protein [Paenibacillus algicola]|uniref:ATPase, histidine kinase-, DNA gyrase B-, and HSP90-like domain protein n=1 Tax=Paenibacillus algicola TaxID=2565926 RepID=A0A4P8XMG1_9BACL|nr:sensor histidine kinase [Paenibacillus algicola]QCT02711.1 ATPase, histidine kinase-, DNA gyrase B-, and HSP90-like domain protein [Paenibacillus algicola]